MGLVICDGLDEVSGDQRRRVREALTEFADLYPRCRLLVTCRVHSYRQDSAWQLPWEVHTLTDFNGEQIHQFLDAWYGAMAALNPRSPFDYPTKARTLKSALDPDDPRGLRGLAGIPLLLTVMAIVHTHKAWWTSWGTWRIDAFTSAVSPTGSTPRPPRAGFSFTSWRLWPTWSAS